MRDIIVHGASGFLGKHFVRKLIATRTPVIILARETSPVSEFENVEGVIVLRYRKSAEELTGRLNAKQGAVFFEFAWQGVFGSERNDDAQLSVNIPMMRRSVILAHAVGASHWVGIGSQAEYGNLDKRISEKDECRPTTLYGKAKLECCRLTGELCNYYGMDHSWLRLFSVYGPDDNHEWLIQYLITEMLRDREINVTKGEQLWDYLYIDDVSEMFFKLKDARGTGVANLGSGKAIKVRTIIEKIKELTNSKSKINFGAVPYREDQVMLMEADITRLSQHLGWKPVITLEEGLRQTIAFVSGQMASEKSTRTS